MSNRFVRASKYRHVFGKANKPENCYDNLRVSRSAWDSNRVQVNGSYIAVNWEAGGGGTFAVLDQKKQGKLPSDQPLVSGHKAPVLDTAWSPYNESLIASVSEDATCKIWQIPEGGLTETLTTPVQNLAGHRRKVGGVEFNPAAANVLATSSTDYKILIWDIEAGEAKCTVDGHANIIQSMDWSVDGKQLFTTSKDKKLRVVDPRSNTVANELESHAGVKGSRVLYLAGFEKLFTVGFSRSAEREYKIWDLKNLAKPVVSTNLDSSSGIIMPFFDSDTATLYLSGKGDGNIRYYEITNDDKVIYPLSEYKSNTPCNGMGFLPKIHVDVSSCEIVRAYKATNTMVEPISFTVPRKSDLFQDDIFPDTRGPEAPIDAAGWFGGGNGEYKMVSLEGGFVLKEKPKQQTFIQKEEPKGPQGEKELKEALDAAQKRVAYLEAEILKKDAKIKELSG